MYLKNLYVENNGPIKTLSIELPFKADGAPKPVVLVGENGSGKTNLLSCIADALFEAAAGHYQDVMPITSGGIRNWFRIVGSQTVSCGSSYGFSLLKFDDADNSYLFSEKAGTLDPSTIKDRVPDYFHPALNWPEKENVKTFKIKNEQAKAIFEKGIYAYFPYSRAEKPHWLNSKSVTDLSFETEIKLSAKLRKPIYVESGLESLEQWLLGLLIDKRADVVLVQPDPNKPPTCQVLGNPLPALANTGTWEVANNILRSILGNNAARFVWLGRHSGHKIGIEISEGVTIQSINALSAGQSTLLSMFGTLLRYGDTGGNFSLPNLEGICLIDEIDAHMHINLQNQVLPALIKLFPRIQFIVASHSPLFVLGMEQTFGSDGLAVIDLPSGTEINAEAYAEFGRALEVVQETKAFARAISDAAFQSGKPLVLFEGETDPLYCRTAAELLGRGTLLDEVELDWVGAKNPEGGQGYNTGDKGLKTTYNALRANQGLMSRSVLLVYDNDTGKPASDEDMLFVRTVPGDPANAKITAGIESLLPEETFREDMFDSHTSDKGNGTTVTREELNKMRLCRYVCEERRNPEDFTGFEPLLNMLEELCLKTASGEGDLVEEAQPSPEVP